MSSNVSLTNLTNSVRLLADNKRLTDAQILPFINQGYSQLYDKLTTAYGADYNLKQIPFLTTTATSYTMAYQLTLSSVSASRIRGRHARPICDVQQHGDGTRRHNGCQQNRL